MTAIPLTRPIPTGPARPPHGIQRGSVEDMPIYPGDPLTPGVGATQNAKRLDRAQAQVHPENSGAADFLCRCAGAARRRWTAAWCRKAGAGACRSPIASGPSKAPVHLAVKSDWSLKPVYDVIAMMKGSELSRPVGGARQSS